MIDFNKYKWEIDGILLDPKDSKASDISSFVSQLSKEHKKELFYWLAQDIWNAKLNRIDLTNVKVKDTKIKNINIQQSNIENIHMLFSKLTKGDK